MKLTRIYSRIPDRVRIGLVGMLLAAVFLASPRLLALWIRAWS